jgi:hypothetical protein
MKIFCTIMVIMFLLFSVLATVGCILEWSGKCATCEDHGEACNVTARARLYSIFTTIILWVCSFTWCWLLWQEYKEAGEELCRAETRVKNLSPMAIENMKNHLG